MLTNTTESQPSATVEALGVGSTMISGKDGMTMLYVPAGEFQMGSDNRGGDEKPVHTVYLDAFWFDQTEVTNAMFSKFIDDTGYETDAQKTGKSYVYKDGSWSQINGTDWQHPSGPDSDISDRMTHPVIHVSWNDASAYCEWAGRRLPTEAEWEKAAGWDANTKKQRVYPWGDSIDDSYANYNSNVGDTTVVGSYEKGASFYSAYDLAGNVWEWVADWYDESYYTSSPSSNPTGPNSGSTRVLRGGSWYNSEDAQRSAIRYWSDPTNTNVDLGFRCSSSP